MPGSGVRGGWPVHEIQVREMEWMREALHDVCQPMTALECGLFIGTMSPDGVRAATADELLATILEALQQCERVSGQIRAIQERMRSES
jgi:hypothetical protein